MLKVSFGQLKPACDTRIIHFDYALEHLFSMDKTEGKKKQRSIRNEKLKANRASETEGKKG